MRKRSCRILRLLVVMWALWFAQPGQASEKLTVALLLGDLDSATAVEAVRLLQADPALSEVRFAVLPASGLRSMDLTPLRKARLVLVNTVGLALARDVAPEMDIIKQNRGKVFAVGSSWSDDVAKLGFIRDEKLRAYMAAGGPENVAGMVRAALAAYAGFTLVFDPPRRNPDFGAFDVGRGRIAESFEDYRAHYKHERPGRPWIGIPFYRSNAVSGQTATLATLATQLENRGFNVIPFYGFPSEQSIERFAFDKDGKPRVAALAALAMKISNNPKTLVPVLQKLDAPVVNLITLNTQNRTGWEASPQGLDIMERSWQVGMAEYGGLIAPTIVASKEKVKDEPTGIEYVRETPIPDRIVRAADRIARLAYLKFKANKDKRVAVMYYNYPPGKENIGASYLNVLPKSLWNMLARMKAEGYDVHGMPASADELLSAVRDRGGNLNSWNSGSIELLVRQGIRKGSLQLLPVSEYRGWLNKNVSAPLRNAMLDKWGDPEKSSIMVWRDAKGIPYFVFPVQQYGNILLAPQPTRGWEQDPSRLYHDISLPPHHQYLAFYLWLQKRFAADAMVHVGTHATHEWQSGKEIGFTAADPGEVLVGPVPQFYPYIVDDIGEGLQAKRRGMATIIAHLTPSLDRAGLNPDLKTLSQLISDWSVAKEKSPQVAETMLAEIDRSARRTGIVKDLGLTGIKSAEQVDLLDDHIRGINEKISPFGLHTFGEAPDEAGRRSTADAILSLESDLGGKERVERLAALAAALEQSGRNELDSLLAGLAGRYVRSGGGNDPMRNPDSIPTGQNFYGFDPTRMPTRSTWAMGEKLANELAESFKKRKGEWPSRLVFNLWGVESNRHEGVMEAQIMALMGIRPKWDARGRVTGVEAIPRAELGRPRVDVTIVPSGLYRDLFAQMMKLLDEAVSTARDQPEEDNRLRVNVLAAKSELMAQGVPEARAGQLASVRLFSVPSGAYGTNLDKVIPLSNTWGTGKQGERQVADVYFMRMHHAFGQGLWGDNVQDRPDLAVDLFKRALKGAQAVVHSRSSNIYATLDNDDFYQYLGGTAMAIRQVNGASPEVLVTNMADPRSPKTETLERYMGREMRARYLNPKWIKSMLSEGYAGARFANMVVEHLWGWQVTVPEAIDGAKWQEMYETWVADKHQLGIRDQFRAAGNMRAYQTMVDRMLVAVRKGYWKADPATIAGLEKANREVIAEAGVGCNRHTCSSPDITMKAGQQDARAARQAQALPSPHSATRHAGRASHSHAAQAGAPASAPARTDSQAKEAQMKEAQAKTDHEIQGKEMEERKVTRQQAMPAIAWELLFALLMVVLAGFLWRRYGKRP